MIYTACHFSFVGGLRHGEINNSKTRLIPPNTTLTTTLKTSEVTDNKDLKELETKQISLDIFHNHSDWLTVNFTKLTEPEFQSLLERIGRGLIVLEKEQPFSQGEKAKNYQNTISLPNGLKGAYNSYKASDSIDNLYDVTISLAGEYFSTLTAIEQWHLYRYLYINYSPSCSRIDASIDDYSFKNIPLDKMLEAYHQGNYFDYREYRKEEEHTSPDNLTTTHYFGGKGSKKLVRLYKHKNESLRLETQFRGKYAQVAFEALATLEREDETDEEWEKIIQKNIGGIAVGAIDFRDKSKLKNRNKACKYKTKRLTFWQDFIDQIGEVHLIKVCSNKPDLTMYQDKFNWLEKMTCKTFAIIFNVVGNEKFISYIYQLVRLGESKLTKQDKKTIEYLRSNRQHLDFD